MPDIGITFGRPFAEQQAAFRLRLANMLPTATWTDLQYNEHDRAFVVAGAMKADLLADLAAAVEKAISQGTTLDQFRKDFREIVQRRGWHGWTGEGSEKGEAWRTRVIYQTNLATSYAAGRRAQLVDGKYKFWVYRHSGAEHPRLHHLAWDGVALPPDHPFWATHSPPNGWGCGCRMFGARSAAGIRRMGGDPDKQLPDGWQVPDAKTGAPPGIDKGWSYAPGATVSEAILTLKDKLPRLPAQVGARMYESWPGRKGADLEREFGIFVDRALSEFVQGRHIVVGALKPEWVDAAIARGVRPETAEIIVTDHDVQHAFRHTPAVTADLTRRRYGASATPQAKVGPVPLDWYKAIPRHLMNPARVLLDVTQPGAPALVLIYDTGQHGAKLVLRINYHPKKLKGAFNGVRTARMMNDGDIAGMLGLPGFHEVKG